MTLKKNLRAEVGQKRSQISNKKRQSDTLKLSHNIQSFFAIHSAEWIATYIACKGEIDPNAAWSNEKLCLPIMDKNNRTLSFVKWDREITTLQSNSDGIYEPVLQPDGKTVMPDYIIVPLLSCDLTGNRLGSGHGYYDKTIASLDIRPTLIGVCFEEQVSDKPLPVEPHDVKLDYIITAERIITI